MENNSLLTLGRTGKRPPRTTFLPFALPHITQAEIDEVVDTLRSGWLTTGPKTKRFEREFAGIDGPGVRTPAGRFSGPVHNKIAIDHSASTALRIDQVSRKVKATALWLTGFVSLKLIVAKFCLAQLPTFSLRIA